MPQNLRKMELDNANITLQLLNKLIEPSPFSNSTGNSTDPGHEPFGPLAIGGIVGVCLIILAVLYCIYRVEKLADGNPFCPLKCCSGTDASNSKNVQLTSVRAFHKSTSVNSSNCKYGSTDTTDIYRIMERHCG